MATIADIVRFSKLKTPDEVREFHNLRKRAFYVAQEIYADRETSYNVDHEPTEEMPFGIVSLASEMFKRVIRMCGIVTPLRQEDLSEKDLERLIDSCIDLMNYASWQYALAVKVARDARLASGGKEKQLTYSHCIHNDEPDKCPVCRQEKERTWTHEAK